MIMNAMTCYAHDLNANACVTPECYREDGDETRRNNDVFLAGKIEKDNREPTYIFARPVLEEKPDNTERSRGKAGGRQEGEAEDASGEIRSERSGPHDRRSDSRKQSR
jgi:hypothetical protein